MKQLGCKVGKQLALQFVFAIVASLLFLHYFFSHHHFTLVVIIGGKTPLQPYHQQSTPPLTSPPLADHYFNVR
jgi:hypothetical protein